ncbi:MAG: peptide deformylase [Candidatus Rokubacteria bacterium]|nr:peptide deformylase [Candidatus Rokubacteria bacterium]
MAVLPIRRFPDPLLKQPTRPVDRVDDRTLALIDAMVRTMRHHPRCVGLAAPQVGSDLRIAVLDASGHPKAAVSHGLLVLVNPKILESGGRILQREGCLSIPDFTGNVPRASRIRLAARDRDGNAMELELEGFEAVVAQHEVDHLDGRLFLDRVANLATDLFRRKRYG